MSESNTEEVQLTPTPVYEEVIELHIRSDSNNIRIDNDNYKQTVSPEYDEPTITSKVMNITVIIQST